MLSRVFRCSKPLKPNQPPHHVPYDVGPEMYPDWCQESRFSEIIGCEERNDAVKKSDDERDVDLE
jgi:hypothetical protein